MDLFGTSAKIEELERKIEDLEETVKELKKSLNGETIDSEKKDTNDKRNKRDKRDKKDKKGHLKSFINLSREENDTYRSEILQRITRSQDGQGVAVFTTTDRKLVGYLKSLDRWNRKFSITFENSLSKPFSDVVDDAWLSRNRLPTLIGKSFILDRDYGLERDIRYPCLYLKSDGQHHLGHNTITLKIFYQEGKNIFGNGHLTYWRHKEQLAEDDIYLYDAIEKKDEKKKDEKKKDEDDEDKEAEETSDSMKKN